MRENLIEQYLTKRVCEAGGLQRKFVSPNHKGVPDRIVVLNGYVHFVELKATGKTLRPDQVREHSKLRSVGCSVWVIDSREFVDHFMESITK